MAGSVLPVIPVERLIRIAFRLAFWPFRVLGRLLWTTPREVKGTLWTLAFLGVLFGALWVIGYFMANPAVGIAAALVWFPALVFLFLLRFKPKGGPRRLPSRRRR